MTLCGGAPWDECFPRAKRVDTSPPGIKVYWLLMHFVEECTASESQDTGIRGKRNPVPIALYINLTVYLSKREDGPRRDPTA